MPNPVSNILKQCQSGFTLGKKGLLSLGIGLYLVSPIDLIPEPLLPFGVMDDLVALFVLLRVWLSPTLPPGNYAGPPTRPVESGIHQLEVTR